MGDSKGNQVVIPRDELLDSQVTSISLWDQMESQVLRKSKMNDIGEGVMWVS